MCFSDKFNDEKIKLEKEDKVTQLKNIINKNAIMAKL